MNFLDRGPPVQKGEMDWDKLRIFHAAAEAGSFTRAGEILNMSQSAVSRQVSALEQELGTPLFHRHARGLILTEEGELLMRAARDIVLKLESVRAKLADSRGQPIGTLRVTTTVGLGSTWLAARVHEFLELLSRHPPGADPRRFGARRGDAAGGRGHPAARADAAGPRPAQALHRAFPRLCLAGLPQALRHAGDAPTTSTSIASSSSARTRRPT